MDTWSLPAFRIGVRATFLPFSFTERVTRKNHTRLIYSSTRTRSETNDNQQRFACTASHADRTDDSIAGSLIVPIAVYAIRNLVGRKRGSNQSLAVVVLRIKKCPFCVARANESPPLSLSPTVRCRPQQGQLPQHWCLRVLLVPQ